MRLKSLVPPPTSTTRQRIARLHARVASLDGLRGQPAIERRLRLLEERRRSSSPPCCAASTVRVAGHVVERRRHGQDDRLLFQRSRRSWPACMRSRLRPCAADSAPKPRPARCAAHPAARLHGNSGAERSTPGWHNHDLAEVTSRPGIRAAVIAGELADGVLALRVPRQGGRAGGQDRAARADRGTTAAATLGDVSRRDELRDAEGFFSKRPVRGLAFRSM